MKKIIIGSVFLFSAITCIHAQIKINSIQNKSVELLINDSISIKKGMQLQVNLPAGKDFVFVKAKKSMFSAKLLGQVASAVGTGASAVGIGSGNIGVLQSATKVVNTANAINYGADAINKIQNLPISDDAKKIAGKLMEISDWELTNDGWIIHALLNKKKYDIYLQEAAMAGEIKL